MAENVFLKECNVKKTNQYDALDFLESFNLGTPLYLFREPEDNKETVFLYYEENDKDNKGIGLSLVKQLVDIYEENDKDNKGIGLSLVKQLVDIYEENDKDNKGDKNRYHKIGIISEEDEDPIDKFLKARQTGTKINEQDINELLLECKVCSIDTNADEDKRIKVAIFIKKK